MSSDNHGKISDFNVKIPVKIRMNEKIVAVSITKQLCDLKTKSIFHTQNTGKQWVIVVIYVPEEDITTYNLQSNLLCIDNYCNVYNLVHDGNIMFQSINDIALVNVGSVIKFMLSPLNDLTIDHFLFTLRGHLKDITDPVHYSTLHDIIHNAQNDILYAHSLQQPEPSTEPSTELKAQDDDLQPVSLTPTALISDHNISIFKHKYSVVIISKQFEDNYNKIRKYSERVRHIQCTQLIHCYQN